MKSGKDCSENAVKKLVRRGGEYPSKGKARKWDQYTYKPETRETISKQAIEGVARLSLVE